MNRSPVPCGGIDFKHVVDSIDDSIFITDAHGNVLYVNPAYERNTGILPREIIGRNVADILTEGMLFTGGATLDVIKTKKRVFRLSTTHKSSPPKVGYTVGVPLLDTQGELKQVVVTSRPIESLRSLREDFGAFLSELNRIKEEAPPVRSVAREQLAPVRLAGSGQLDHILPIAYRAAKTDATILITGESGVGKEVLADEIVAHSNRGDRPYVKVNCTAIPQTLLESELFGYEKGAFSGANSAGKPGIFELGNHGTVLLDEIGDMPIDMQVKLLRVLQNRQVLRIGGTRAIDLDIRFIALTNSDLKEKIEAGSFRKDLYYRLSVVPLHIPPLRDRTSDIEELCGHFIDKCAPKYGRRITLSQDQLDLMKLYDWPGNIRELENIIEYLVICNPGDSTVDDRVLRKTLNDLPARAADGRQFDLAQAVEQYEKQLIEKGLRVSSNLREAGTMLNVNASTLSRKIRQYGIDYRASRSGGDLS